MTERAEGTSGPGNDTGGAGSEPARISTCDLHVAGEPLRVVVGGWPELPGRSIVDKRRYQERHYDHLRRAILWEPRGHADMFGCLVTGAENPDGCCGVIFMHNSGYASMCGHGMIGLVTYLLETDVAGAPGETPALKIDTAAGLVSVRAVRRGRRIGRVSFDSVPSFVHAMDETVDVPGVGRLAVDIAFGGAFYAVCRAEDLRIELTPGNVRGLIDLGMRVKASAAAKFPLRYPFIDELNHVFGTIIVGAAHSPGHHSRNVCIFADGELDRSPTGTGISARAALLHARGEIGLGEAFTVESILGTTFQGRIMETPRVGPHPAVVTEVTGSAVITGRSEFVMAPDDPLRHGFFLRY